MSEPFLAEVRIFSFTYAPRGWAVCNGQILPIRQNTALFSLLGTTYGGDGVSTFALPNFQGLVPVQQGQGSGLSYYNLGETGGVSTVTLIEAQMPVHAHSVLAASGRNTANNFLPSPSTALAPSANAQAYASGVSPGDTMALQGLPPAGDGLPHTNLQPYLYLNFCIALQGLFPQRP